MCVLTIENSHRPDGRLTFCSLFAGRRCLCPVRHGHDNYTITSSPIYGNTAPSVRAHVQNFPSPRWETHICSLFAGRWCRCLGRHSDHLIVHHQWEHSYICARSCSKLSIAPMGKWMTSLLRLPCTTAADAPVNYSAILTDVYVPQRPEISPSPQWECLADMQFDSRRSWDQILFYQGWVRASLACKSPSPRWETHICSLFAGRWCRCLGRHMGSHSDHLIVHHQWEHSYICARSCSIVPITPKGTLLTCLPRLTLAHLRTLRSTTERMCHRNLENVPSPSWETHDLLVVCRAAVSMSMVAQ
jgi:hypothetical protein